MNVLLVLAHAGCPRLWAIKQVSVLDVVSDLICFVLRVKLE